MITDGKTGTLKQTICQGNQSGSGRINKLSHAQRIEIETFKEYNISKSHRHLEQVKRYAELAGNCKK